MGLDVVNPPWTVLYGTSQNKVPMVLIVLSMPLHNVIREGTLEPCHLHLVLSTCPTIMFNNNFYEQLQCTPHNSNPLILNSNSHVDPDTSIFNTNEANF